MSEMEPDRPSENNPDAIVRYLKSPAYKARREFIDSIFMVPDFGIGHLSLQKAADLLAVDLWSSGDIEANVPEGDSENDARGVDDPILMKALEPQRSLLLARLNEAVVRGTLKTSKAMRDLITGGYDPEKTFIEYENLRIWMEEFGWSPGDWMSSYIDGEGNVLTDLEEALADIRILHSSSGTENERKLQARRLRARLNMDFDNNPEFSNASIQEMREIVNGYAEEVAYLKHELTKRPALTEDRPLQPKSRNTLYRLIVALCVAAKIDPSHRNAAATIEGLTQRVGLPVGDDTIRKVLSELPEIESP